MVFCYTYCLFYNQDECLSGYSFRFLFKFHDHAWVNVGWDMGTWVIILLRFPFTFIALAEILPEWMWVKRLVIEWLFTYSVLIRLLIELSFYTYLFVKNHALLDVGWDMSDWVIIHSRRPLTLIIWGNILFLTFLQSWLFPQIYLTLFQPPLFEWGGASLFPEENFRRGAEKKLLKGGGGDS